MKWTKLHTGSLFTTLAVILLCCLPDFADAGMIRVRAPKIIEVNNATSGKQLTVSCKVDPGLLPDETLVYWLVNESFIDSAFPKGRVQMYTNDSNKYIQSDLVFKYIKPQDFQSNFTCVALSPTGMDTKSVLLHDMIKNTKRHAKKMCSTRRFFKSQYWGRSGLLKIYMKMCLLTLE
ncbi:interleukin-1 receptor type 2-like [Xyrauchen texanus]|uniref:interleukin-1 receptor type 2-like n=1 Tax=Xyrauchen texanus TaxID=154827 RepID=UPI002241D6C0|nr:interleukin-1 receptor type 2-like [Xyrauchen texanus]